MSAIKSFASKFNLDANKVLEVLKKSVFPRNKDDNGNVVPIADEMLMSFLLVCDRYDLDPFRKEIIPFSDKRGGFVPVVTIDGWLKIIVNHPKCDGFELTFSKDKINVQDLNREVPESCTCTIYRKDWSHPVVTTELMLNCYKPKIQLKNYKTKQDYTVATPWQSHPERMLKHKTMIQGVRYALGFGDIYDSDEAANIVEANNAQLATTPLNLDVEQLHVEAPNEVQQIEARPTNAPQTTQEFFEDQSTIQQQEEQVVVESAYDINNVHPEDKARIDELVGFAKKHDAFEAILDKLEDYHGDTKAYGMDMINQSYKQSHAEA